MWRLTLAVVASHLLLVQPAAATITDMGIFTRDTMSGFDWLDVTETLGLSHDEVVVGQLMQAGHSDPPPSLLSHG